MMTFKADPASPPSKKKQCEIPEGFELRGFVVRLYPTHDQVAVLSQLQAQSRFVWNTLVRYSDEPYRAREGWAIRQGIVERFITWDTWRAQRDLPEHAERAEWKTYAIDRRKAINAAAKQHEGLQPVRLKDLLEHFGDKYDYQFCKRVLTWRDWGEDAPKSSAHILQALCKNLYSKGVKRARKCDNEMPLRVRSAQAFELGNFGDRRNSSGWYNCQITFNGLKVRGRLPGKEPHGRVIEGVAISHKPDGWYAAVREVVPIREMQPAVVGRSVGIDVGLIDLIATSEGLLVSNSRSRAFQERIAGRQAQKLPVGRLQQRTSRHVLQQCYELARDLGTVEHVFIERLPGKIGQCGTPHVSAMRKVADILHQRLGSRVREVEPAYTSQTCAQCGHIDKQAWNAGRVCTCPACGHKDHRDLNAARNICAKGLKALGV